MRPYEFWNPRVFEAPYYLFLLLQCLRRRLPIRFMAKANYALDHGELGLGSKFTTQLAFDQAWFPQTELLSAKFSGDEQKRRMNAFATKFGYPLILKPDIGNVGKGVVRLNDAAAIGALQPVAGDHLLQAYVSHEYEYGVFFVRKNGVGKVSGINRKHFPTVIGNGRESIAELARAHPRHTSHWKIFLQYIDVDRVPADGEITRLSFIGSHTMGCKFTNDTHLLTANLEASINELCASQPGFNFGRFDVKAASDAAFQEGDFVVLEVNGVASLPTHMFDPDNSILEAYRIFLRHGADLVTIANEHRNKPMELKSYRELWETAKSNDSALNKMHRTAMSTT